LPRSAVERRNLSVNHTYDAMSVLRPRKSKSGRPRDHSLMEKFISIYLASRGDHAETDEAPVVCW
jgi:hypothetical protein